MINKLPFYVTGLVVFATLLVNSDLTEEALNGKILSRRKRYLIFPEGSSLQLVFCVTYLALIPIDDIFLWGNTAALAWELPMDPYSPFRHKADPLHRRGDTKVHFTDFKGNVLFSKPYERARIINPVFAKRSIDSPESEKSIELKPFNDGTKDSMLRDAIANKRTRNAKWIPRVDRAEMHQSQHRREFLNPEHMSLASIQFHRHSRKGLYQKLESLLVALGLDGKQCLQRLLCEMGITKEHPQGSFMHEMLRVAFTFPSDSRLDEKHRTHYDQAHSGSGSGGNCEQEYPECEVFAQDRSLTALP